ncbi:hypothetical protein [Reinekea marinisedimentorum]|uniref:Big-1 domain-containing protein n=1 Tax=Reinekea marinisedimentorum TaxID=230495 RepID=A0A4R3I5D3_9GAMM|nr:hypothetical protein [Reinekea marinisedimentorum]TCS41172.1 hypothetical protein BCF53_107187 [Reinekea marinisedimentorum]
MNPKSKWLIALMTMLALTACGNVDDEDDDDSSDDTDTTEETTDDDSDDSTTTTTGNLPDYDSFSLSVDAAVVDEALNTDGITATFTVQVADRFNEAVDDDTVVYFWAENGYLQENTCSTSSGSCSVTWVSGGTRPEDGLATVLAYTVGEDSFYDSGTVNGIYNVAGDVVDDGQDGLALNEAIMSAPEAYKDYNFDGYDNSSFTDSATGLTFSEDAFFDYNDNGEYEASSSLYRGENCSAAASTAGHCTETSIYIWDHTQIVWGPTYGSPNTAVSADYTTDFDAVTDVTDWNVGDTIYVLVSDYNGNTPVAGTSIAVSGDDDDDEDFTVSYSSESVPTLGVAYNLPYVFSLTLTDAFETGGTAEITVTYLGSDYSLYVDY